jgi:citrate synthase
VLHEDVLGLIRSFRRGAHTTGMLVGTVGSLSTFYDDVRDFDSESRSKNISRIIRNVSAASAYSHRHSKDLPDHIPQPRPWIHGGCCPDSVR